MLRIECQINLEMSGMTSDAMRQGKVLPEVLDMDRVKGIRYKV